ncbi:MAG: hypothetical protein PHQ96_09015, partial [Candidatus Omnitrophica bacterium]|nr:hypothetical protein [Candidatus Omnitrophota bacterium]
MAELLISLFSVWQDNTPSGKKWFDSLVLPFFNRRCLKNIPRWACIAFGARCARRVENLITSGEPNSDASRHRSKISAVIELAEKAASLGRFEGDKKSFTSPESAGNAASIYLPQMGSVFNDASRVAGAVIFSTGLADPATP